MGSDKKTNTIIIGLIIVIILIINQNIRFKREINDLQNIVHSMESNLSQGINNLDYTISRRVEAILNDQQNMVSDYNSTYNSIDSEKRIVKTLVEFTLKQVDGDSKVYLNVSSQNNTNSKDYECTSINGFKYTCEVELSYEDNYLFNMYQKSNDGSYKKLNSKEYSNNVKSDFESRVRVIEKGIGINKESTDFSFTLQNNTFGSHSFKIKTVVVHGFYKDKEVFTKDVTNYNIVNLEARDRLRVMIAAGEIDSTALPEIEYSSTSMDPKGEEQYGDYMVNVLHSETGADVSNNELPKYDFKIIVTLYNGDIFEF